MEKLSNDFTRADSLDLRDRTLLDYAARLAKEPWAISSDDVGQLRRVGFSDRAILEANLVTGYMSFVNRLAQGLGVELEDYFRQFRR